MTLLLLKETILVVAVLSIDTGAGGSGITSLSGCERPNVAEDTTHTTHLFFMLALIITFHS